MLNGSSYKKSKTGCGSGLLLIAGIFVACLAMSQCDSGGSSHNDSSDDHYPADYTVREAPSTVAFTTKEKKKPEVKFDEVNMWTIAQIYAEKRINPKTKMKWIGNRKVEKLRKFQQFKGQIYAVEQEFTILNLHNVEVKHHARVIMEYLPDKGYRGVWLTVDGKAWQ